MKMIEIQLVDFNRTAQDMLNRIAYIELVTEPYQIANIQTYLDELRDYVNETMNEKGTEYTICQECD